MRKIGLIDKLFKRNVEGVDLTDSVALDTGVALSQLGHELRQESETDLLQRVLPHEGASIPTDIETRSMRDTMPEDFYKMFIGYTPMWTTTAENIYEMEKIRAVIHSFASFCSKLKPEIQGASMARFNTQWASRINPFMDTSKFIYRLATILSVNNNAFIIPLEDMSGAVIGLYPLLPQNCEVIDHQGTEYLRYTFSNGQRAAIEFSRVGILNQHQYQDDFFGESNGRVLKTTLQAITTANEGITNSVKSSAQIRFIAKIAGMIKPEDVTKQRDKFASDNLGSDNKSGLMVYDDKFGELKQVNSTPTVINAAQMKAIDSNIYSYFGISEAILQNDYTEDQYNAYHEGKISPFANQLSLVVTNMLFSTRELSHGNAVTFTSNRLEYASNRTKITLVTQMLDRGVITINEARVILGKEKSSEAHADKLIMRREYGAVSDLTDDGDSDPT